MYNQTENRMKKFSILIIALILAPVMLSAFNNQLPNINDASYPPLEQIITKVRSESILGKISNPEILANYKPIDTIGRAIFMVYDNVTPVVYEPISKSLVIGSSRFGVLQGEQIMTGIVYVNVSTNMGASWGRMDLYSEQGIIPVRESVGVVNTDGTTNPNDLHYFLFGKYAQHQGGDYPWAGGHYTVASPAASFAFTMAGPDNNNPGYSWNSTPMTSTGGLGIALFLHGGRLEYKAGLQYGAYGLASFYIDPDNQTADMQYSGIPDRLNVNNFRPAEQLASTYNDEGYVGADDNGNLYFFANNMFTDNPEVRVPGVIKSNDMGTTWSQWNKMPAQLIDDYVANQQGSLVLSRSLLAYNINSFVVIDEDKYSFFTRLYYQKSEQEGYIHLVECHYNGSNWQILPVAELKGFNFWVLQNVAASGAAFRDSLMSSEFANEIGGSVTVDGQNLFVKWIDYTGKMVPINPPVTVWYLQNQQVSIDTLETTDVFFSYRNINGSWQPKKNLTNDDLWNNLTFVPAKIPSLNQVPLVTYQTIQATNPTHPRVNYPYTIMTQLAVDQEQITNIIVFDAVNFNSVEEKTTNISLSEMYPNPAKETINLPLNIEKDGLIKVEVFTTLGVKVATVHNSNMSAGNHLIPISTAGFNSGVYICKVSMNGSVNSQMFTVQR